MKNIIKYLYLLTVGLILLSTTSCSGFLDQAPTSEESIEYIFQDYTRSLRYMDLLYYYMAPTWAQGGKFGGYYGFLESATDMAEYSSSYGATNVSFNVGNWKHTAAATEVDRWSASYDQIRRSYMFLENMDGFNNEPQGRKETMRGEVHFMIAYYYFELLRRYGGVPIVDKTLTLESEMKIPRATYEETLDFILNNLEEAEKLLPLEWQQDDIGRVNTIWIKALRSRILLHAASPLNNPENDRAKWIDAAKEARELIDLCESSGMHSLSHDWQSIFMRGYPDREPEILVYKKTSTNFLSFTDELVQNEQASPGNGFWGYGSNSPSQNFVDRFEVLTYDAMGEVIGSEPFDWDNADHVANMYKNRDPRFYYTVLYNNRMWIKRRIETWFDGSNYGADIDPKNHNFSRTGYYLRKFWPRECRDRQDPGSAELSAFYIRLGEIYLNYAEAMNEAFGPDSDGLAMPSGTFTAVDAINALRGRLICPPSEEITGEQHQYHYVKVERDENPDFPVLKNGMPKLPLGLSVDQARERIHNERVIELCFEDQYFYDILRWKKGDKHIGTDIYGVRILKTGENFTYTRNRIEERSFDASRMYLYPIPQDEVYRLNIEQNPGW